MMRSCVPSAAAYFVCLLLLGQAAESAPPPPQGYMLKDMEEIIAAGMTRFLAAHHQIMQGSEAPSDAGIASAAEVSLDTALQEYGLLYSVFFFDSSALGDSAIYTDPSLVRAGCDSHSPPDQCAVLGGVMQSSTSIAVNDVAKSWVVIYTPHFHVPTGDITYCPFRLAYVDAIYGPLTNIQAFCKACTNWQDIIPWVRDVPYGPPARTRFVQAAIGCIKYRYNKDCKDEGGVGLVRVIVVLPSVKVEGRDFAEQQQQRRPGRAIGGNTFIADGAVFEPRVRREAPTFPPNLYVVVGILPAIPPQQAQQVG